MIKKLEGFGVKSLQTQQEKINEIIDVLNKVIRELKELNDGK